MGRLPLTPAPARRALLAWCLVGLASTATATGAELPLDALAAVFDGESGRSRVTVWLGVPGVELVGAERSSGSLELSARVRLVRAAGEESEVEAAEVEAAEVEAAEVDTFTVAAEIDLETGAERLRRSHLQVYGDLVAPPGRYRLVLELDSGIRGEEAEKRARRAYPFEIEAAPPGRPRVLPPFFIDDAERVWAFYETLGENADEPPADYPFVAGGELFVPDIAPRADGDMPRRRISLMGYRLSSDQMLVDTGLVAADGTLLGKDRLQVVGRDEADSRGLEKLNFGLDTQGLVPGDYQLNVSLHDFERGATEQVVMPFAVEP